MAGYSLGTESRPEYPRMEPSTVGNSEHHGHMRRSPGAPDFSHSPSGRVLIIPSACTAASAATY